MLAVQLRRIRNASSSVSRKQNINFAIAETYWLNNCFLRKHIHQWDRIKFVVILFIYLYLIRLKVRKKRFSILIYTKQFTNLVHTIRFSKLIVSKKKPKLIKLLSQQFTIRLIWVFRKHFVYNLQRGSVFVLRFLDGLWKLTLFSNSEHTT